jgi:thiazolinyl imide reductase
VSAQEPLRVLVCGTNFGRLYAQAVRNRPGYELAGLLARGSQASRSYARELGVPLYTSVAELPAGEADMACVVVGSAVSGGKGTELAQELMSAGLHVLQEHPLHLDELTACVRHAHRHGVQYRMNTHYPQVGPVREFIATAQRLAQHQKVLFVDAATPVHLMQPLVDILGRALGTLRPWRFAQLPLPPEDLGPQPFRSVQGVLGGVPLTLRVHHQLDPADRDNHALHWHRISIGTRGGVLTLADTHGPLLWSPRMHAYRDADHRLILTGPGTAHLDLETTSVAGTGTAGTFRTVLTELWPEAIGRALDELAEAVRTGTSPLASAQYNLAVCQVWSDLAALLGPPEVVHPPLPQPLPAYAVFPDHELSPDHHQPRHNNRPAAGSDSYSPSAEFFDLVAAEHTATASAPAVAAALTGLDVSTGAVVDLGAGTGLITEAVARALPNAAVVAAEPAVGMRAVLTSRVFGDVDLRARVTVTDGEAPELDLPDRICAAVLCGVLGHLDAVQRRRLWDRLLARLTPDGRVVVELMQLTAPAELPPTRLATAMAGRHRYEWWLSGAPESAGPVRDGDAVMRLHTTWRVYDEERAAPLREVQDTYRWFPLGLDRVAEESGLHARPLPTRPGAPPLALLTRTPAVVGCADDKTRARADIAEIKESR